MLMMEVERIVQSEGEGWASSLDKVRREPPDPSSNLGPRPGVT